jgi:hypothetical protein
MTEPKIVNVKPLEHYTIQLEYETGEVKLFNVLPYISGTWYEELRDIRYFKTVHLVSGGRGIAWEHGQDIAPHELYDMSATTH